MTAIRKIYFKGEKIIFFILSVATIIIFNSCSNENLVGIKTKSSSEGGIALKIQKTTIPSDVQQIIAELSRTNYVTLRASTSVSNDSLNELSFSSVPIGQWHLEVVAENPDGQVIYSGSADITILEDQTIDVYINLIPAGTGTGNINIVINWNQSGARWADYQGNPILSVKDIPYYTLAVDQAQVMFDDGKYKIWFENLYNSGHGDIGYAESNDGLTWQVNASNPVLAAGQPGAWDDYTVGLGYIFKENGIYKLYYAGMQEPHTGERQIGFATSPDGIHWEKYSNPVLLSTASQYFLGVHSIQKINGLYYMYYEASPENDYTFNLNLATSSDGIQWTKYNNNPVLIADQTWENGSIGYATIVQINNEYKMTYSTKVQNAVGMAYSNDGIHWTKDKINPVFKLSDASNGWCTKISYPFSVIIGNDYRIYYSGYGKDNQFHLGVAFWK